MSDLATTIAALQAAIPQPRQPQGETDDWPLGTRVRKVKGSSWQGRIVGVYSTAQTAEGYCVESEREPGSVQIYPRSALEVVPADASPAPAMDTDAVRGWVESWNARWPARAVIPFKSSEAAREWLARLTKQER